MSLTVLTPREASMFACICDTVVAPEDPLPQVRDTDAVVAFDRTLAVSPPLNRAGIRAMVVALEVLPALRGGRRLRRLARADRAAALAHIEATAAGAGLVKAVRGMAHLAYYGDEAVMHRLGYDPDAVVARAAAVRAQEGRW